MISYVKVIALIYLAVQQNYPSLPWRRRGLVAKSPADTQEIGAWNKFVDSRKHARVPLKFLCLDYAEVSAR
jgi:hypothetical protein